MHHARVHVATAPAPRPVSADQWPLASAYDGLMAEFACAGTAVVRAGRLLACNRRFAEIFASAEGELVGLPCARLLGRHVRSQVDWRAVPWAADGCVPRPIILDALTLGGAAMRIASSMVRVHAQNGPVVIWSVVDVSHATTPAPRVPPIPSAEQFMRAQEAERQRVARELHDGIGQTLSAVKLALSADRPTPECASCTSLSRGALRVQQAIDEVRRIALGLRPSMLDDLGLLAAIRWYCRECRTTSGKTRLNCDLHVTEAQVPHRLRIVIFRVVQEAVRNALTHAHAEEVRVRLVHRNGKLRLTVEDDGSGISPTRMKAAAEGGLGLYSMRERTLLSGGHFFIHSNADSGTRVGAEWLST